MDSGGRGRRLVLKEEPDLTDEELIRRIQAGDERSFQTLFDRYLGTLQAYARRWLPDKLRRKVSVADILQEARLVALRRCVDFEHRSDDSVRNWLLKIVERKVRELVRNYRETAKRAVEREVSRGQRPDTLHLPGRGPTPSEFASARELAELARRAMQALPDHYRAILRLAREERLSLREIAERMDRSRDAVKKLYGRALSRFTEEFERLGGSTHG
ncbi:MAG: RNA polymerase sigma factor [Planctomycetota bacterium]|jgi:RNA polymerase sigma-70 factor (ECF subfamily)